MALPPKPRREIHQQKHGKTEQTSNIIKIFVAFGGLHRSIISKKMNVDFVREASCEHYTSNEHDPTLDYNPTQS